ncbi:BrnA antitoxin family protein [Paracoccus zhejiangensis]|nr:BrnA antitoxin family protein [Paracoccus zhejiangensis]
MPRKTYIDEDGEALELDQDWFARAKPSEDIPELADVVRRGRPALAEADRKQRVTIYLDRDLVERLKEEGKGWQTRANALLRKATGLKG